jgi:hypothetical protein
MRVRILHVGVLAFIMLASCRPSPDDLLLAAKQGKVEQIQRLLDRGVPITVADRAGETSRKGRLGTLFAGNSPIGMTVEKFLSLQGIPESTHAGNS